MAKDTPLWDVMLQSAQVINQSFQLEQKAMAEQQRLELEAKRMSDLQAAREEKIRMQEEALNYKQQADQAKMEVEWAKIQNQSRGVEVREMEATNREAHYQRQDAIAAARETRQKLSSTAEPAAIRAADAIVRSVSEDASRYARTGDKLFDEQNQALFAMPDDRLASRYAKLTDVKPLDELIIKELADKYPQYATVAEQKEAEKRAINRIIAARTEEYNSRAETALKTTNDPLVRQWLKTRMPDVNFGEALGAGTETPARTQLSNPGQAAMAPAADTAQKPPLSTVPGMTQWIAEAQRIRAMDTSSKESQAARAVVAAELINSVRNSAGPDQLTAAVQQILYELSGNTDLKDTFTQDIIAEMDRRGFGSSQGKKRAPAATNKEK